MWVLVPVEMFFLYWKRTGIYMIAILHTRASKMPKNFTRSIVLRTLCLAAILTSFLIRKHFVFLLRLFQFFCRILWLRCFSVTLFMFDHNFRIPSFSFKSRNFRFLKKFDFVFSSLIHRPWTDLNILKLSVALLGPQFRVIESDEPNQEWLYHC